MPAMAVKVNRHPLTAQIKAELGLMPALAQIRCNLQ
jgi:hypothetical protein